MVQKYTKAQVTYANGQVVYYEHPNHDVKGMESFLKENSFARMSSKPNVTKIVKQVIYTVG